MLAAAAPGEAAVTRSSVRAPSGSPPMVVVDLDAGPPLVVSGTTDGTTGDSVDVSCLTGSASQLLAVAVPVAADGSFSHVLSSAEITAVAPRTCYLHALPAGPTPADPAPFAGPSVSLDALSTANGAGGPYDFSAALAGAAGLARITSLGGCGLDAAATVQAVSLATSEPLFACAGRLAARDPAGARADIQVDGSDALAPAAAHAVAPTAPGAAALSHAVSVDAATGAATLSETDPVVRCGPSCGSLAGTGVSVSRVGVEDHGGRQVSFTDTWSSTDGGSHALDVQYEVALHDGSGGNTALAPGWSVPWVGGAFSAVPAGATAPAPPAVPASIYTRGALGAADGDVAWSWGAVTIDSMPDAVRFATATTLLLDYRRTVAPGAPVVLTHVFSWATALADERAAARAAEDRLAPPVVHIDRPRDGARLALGLVMVTGTATDTVGVASLTLNGHPVPVGRGGAWSVDVNLSRGQNDLVAQAADAAGNTAKAMATVTFAPIPGPRPRCLVPRLRGKTLLAATHALAVARCSPGRMSTARSRVVRRGRVISQRPRPGSRVANGTRVRLVLSRGR